MSASTAARAVKTAGGARRVTRDVNSLYMHVHEYRKLVSYKGGWQNSLQKMFWFWYGFKKYGLLHNIANCLRQRESWWETGEKRLVGMDAIGHRYWESDEVCRLNEGGLRFIDYPFHFHWHDWNKLPMKWDHWLRGIKGRSPPQLEQLHNELGPEWRDFLMTDMGVSSSESSFARFAEEDTWRHPQIADGTITGTVYFNPFHPEYNKTRRWFGHGPRSRIFHHHTFGTRNLYDIDEFDPDDGLRHMMEFQGHGHDRHSAQLSGTYDLDDPDYDGSPFTQTPHVSRIGGMNNHQERGAMVDGGKYSSDLLWSFRERESRKAKHNREYISAFDDIRYSSANKFNYSYGTQSEFRSYREGGNEVGIGFKHSRQSKRYLKQV